MLDDVIEILLDIVLDGAMEAANSPKVPMPIRIILGGLILVAALAVIGLIAWVGIDSESTVLVIFAAVLLIGMTILMIRKIKKYQREK